MQTTIQSRMRSASSSCVRPAACRPALRMKINAQAAGSGQINPSIKKDEPKVADILKVADLPAGKAVFCRCWRSSKFPYCDGAHVAHNKETGDNVGPLVIENPK